MKGKLVLLLLLVVWVMTACVASHPVEPTLHPVLWYYQNGRTYQFDLQKQAAQEYSLPTKPDWGNPVLSHNGNLLAYPDKLGLRVVDIADAKTVLTVPHLETSPVTNLTDTIYIPYYWSPDDKWLLVRTSRYESDGLGLVNVVSGEVSEIINTNGYKLTCSSSGATWSPGSSKIIFTQDNPDFCQIGLSIPGVYWVSPNSVQSSAFFTHTFVVHDPNKKEPVNVIGSAGSPSWRPGSDEIVLSQETNWILDQYGLKTPTINLILIRSNGTALSAVTSNSTGQAYSPVWDAHGEHLFFANRQTGKMPDGIYSSRPDGTDAHLIVAGEKLAPLAVSPDGNYLVYGQRQPEAFAITTSPSWTNGLWVIDLRNSTSIVIDAARFVGWQMKTN